MEDLPPNERSSMSTDNLPSDPTEAGPVDNPATKDYGDTVAEALSALHEAYNWHTERDTVADTTAARRAKLTEAQDIISSAWNLA